MHISQIVHSKMENVEIKSGETGKTLSSKSDVKCFETIFSEVATSFIESESYRYYVPDLVLEILKTRSQDQIKELINEFQVSGLDRWYNEGFVDGASDKYNVPVDDVIQLYHICSNRGIAMNAHDSGDPKGSGIYKYLSFIDHSCDPNAKFNTLDSKIGLESIQSIKQIKQGDEITVNYLIDVSSLLLAKWSVEERQSIIRSRLKFVCRCAKCRLELSQQQCVVVSRVCI